GHVLPYLAYAPARRALLDKAKVKARAHGGKVTDWLDQFVFQRFLARIFDTDPDGWLLKAAKLSSCAAPTHERPATSTSTAKTP
ncbi:MAG: hypothetical protein ACREHV_16930, partial [Rhizomicrobium sp.]